MSEPKYPELRVPLIGHDGNAFAILGRAQRVMRNADLDNEFHHFHNEACSGDYDHLLRTVMRWFSTDDEADYDEDDEDNWDNDRD